MQKFQVQFVIGPYTVNHITEGESKESVLNSFRERCEDHRATGAEFWEIEDVVMDPECISLIRVTPYFEKVEGQTIDMVDQNDG